MLVHPEPRSVLGDVAATVYGRPSEHLTVVGVTGTSGKTTTTYLIEAGLRSAGADGGPDRHRRSADQRRRHPQRADHTRGACVAGAAGGDGRARRRHRGDGSVQPCADPGARRRHPLRGRRIHQPVPRPSRLPPDHGGLLRGQGATVRPGVAAARPARGGVRRRRCRPRDGAPRRQGGHGQHQGPARRLARRGRHGARRCAGVHRDRPGRRPSPDGHRACPATTTSPIVLSHWRFSTPSGFPRSRRRRACGTPRSPGGSSRSTAARTSSRWSTTRTSRARCTRCCGRLRRPDGRLAVVFGAGGDRDPGKRVEMGRIAAELADLVVVTDDNPRSEDPAAIRREILAGTAEAGSRHRGGRDRGPARGDRPRRGVGGGRGRGADRRKGPRNRPDPQWADAALRRPGRARRRA